MPEFLSTAVAHLRSRVASVSDPALRNDLAVVALGLDVLTREYDVCAERRVREISTLSDILARGAGLSPGRFSWEEDLDDKTADLKISTLEKRLDVLRRCLIELQAWLEENTSPPAASLLDQVLRFEYEAAKGRARKTLMW